MRSFRTLSMTLGCLVAAAGQLHASIQFDNFKGTGVANYVEETRNANFTFGTVVNSTATTTINQMEFRWRPNNDMNVTFYIFDSELAGSFGSVNWAPIGNNVLFSQTKFFSAVNGPVDYWLVTDPFSFTFLPNHRYDIGILGSSGTLTGSWDIVNGFGNINTIEGGFESINRNANLSGSQSDLGYAGVDPHIRLLVDDNPAVPEPMSLAVWGAISIGAIALGWRRIV